MKCRQLNGHAHFVAPELNRFLLGGVMVCQRYQTKTNDEMPYRVLLLCQSHIAWSELGEHLTSLRLLLHDLKTSSGDTWTQIDGRMPANVTLMGDIYQL